MSTFALMLSTAVSIGLWASIALVIASIEFWKRKENCRRCVWAATIGVVLIVTFADLSLKEESLLHKITSTCNRFGEAKGEAQPGGPGCRALVRSIFNLEQ
jgi:hypothetical protein